MNKIVFSLIALAGAGTAHADAERDAMWLKQDLESLASKLPKVAPAPGRDTAPVRPPPWCAVAKRVEGTPGAIARHIEGGAQYANTWDRYLDAAEMTCLWPKELGVQQAVAVIEQSWINLTGLSEPDALATFEARLQRDRLMADKKRLCDAITVSDEVDGAARAFAAAKRDLFTCDNHDAQPMWSTGASVPANLGAFLEVGEPDELVRLAQVLDHSAFIFGRPRDDKFLISYVVDGVDYRALSGAAALKVLDTAPYKGNSYARAVVIESLGRTRLAIAAIDAAVKAKVTDPDWKELLVAAPERGIAEWNKQAAVHKAEIARSNEFEAKLFGPSKKALAGCYPDLRADLFRVLGHFKHDTMNDLASSFSEPVASLLFDRFAACSAAEGDPVVAAELLAMGAKLRYSRGPRTAAYYAALEAIGKIRADRDKFAIEPKDLLRFAIRDVGLHQIASELLAKRGTRDMFVFDGVGVVESIRKTDAGVRISFPTKKWTVMEQACVETNRIVQITSDGKLIYDQICHDIGYRTMTDKPHDVTVPADLAAGIVAGAAIDYRETPDRIAFPTAVYTDKSKKKLVAFYGYKL